MKKSIIFLLLALSLFVSLGLVSNSAAHNNQPILANPTATPKVLAKIERLELDKKRIIIGCPPIEGIAKQAMECPDDDGQVNVSTIVSNPKNLALSYHYEVSGGKIIGEGANVVWDLKNVRPQTHKITVSIRGNNEVSSETKFREIEMEECCCLHCICPTLSVTGGGEVKAGENMFFTAKAIGGENPVKYLWTISDGEIIDGQGTPKITVKTNSDLIGKTITATVETVVETCPSCTRMVSETGRVVE